MYIDVNSIYDIFPTETWIEMCSCIVYYRDTK